MTSELNKCIRAHRARAEEAPGHSPGFGVTTPDGSTRGPSPVRVSPSPATQARLASSLRPTLSHLPQPQFCPPMTFVPVSIPNTSPPPGTCPLPAQLNSCNRRLMGLGQQKPGSWAVQRAGALEGKGPWGKSGLTSGRPYRGNMWHIAGVRLEGSAEAIVDCLNAGLGGLGFSLGVCSRPDESGRGEFYIRFTCNSIHRRLMEHLPCARHSASSGSRAVSDAGRVVILTEDEI